MMYKLCDTMFRIIAWFACVSLRENKMMNAEENSKREEEEEPKLTLTAGMYQIFQVR